MSKFIVIAVVAILIYTLVLSPQMRDKVNEKATNSIKEFGTMAVDKITEKNGSSTISAGQNYGATPPSSTDYGKPSCKSNTDCAQFGSNISCNMTTGHCVGG